MSNDTKLYSLTPQGSSQPVCYSMNYRKLMSIAHNCSTWQVGKTDDKCIQWTGIRSVKDSEVLWIINEEPFVI